MNSDSEMRHNLDIRCDVRSVPSIASYTGYRSIVPKSLLKKS
jgi:hypothetical protein